MKRIIAFTVGFVLTTAAIAADGGFHELKYDNGVRALQLAWYTGSGRWVGNDFDISTLKTKHNVIREMKFFTSPYWPDNKFDGFRLAVFDCSSGLPGARLWPEGQEGRYVKPAGREGFKKFWVNYYLKTRKFVAAVEQYYDYPDCDPYFCDSNPTFLVHSWQKEPAKPWQPLSGLQPHPYRNLMLRVIVHIGYSEIGVTPTSLGRVKALYY
ncbi:MAG: hypothetical protein GTN49_06215 [candidate division Zixibacteria bacterium]|nr:hypothetical protein [candidate division Zixibacteria bacterium]